MDYGPPSTFHLFSRFTFLNGDRFLVRFPICCCWKYSLTSLQIANKDILYCLKLPCMSKVPMVLPESLCRCVHKWSSIAMAKIAQNERRNRMEITTCGASVLFYLLLTPMDIVFPMCASGCCLLGWGCMYIWKYCCRCCLLAQGGGSACSHGNTDISCELFFLHLNCPTYHTMYSVLENLVSGTQAASMEETPLTKLQLIREPQKQMSKKKCTVAKGWTFWDVQKSLGVIHSKHSPPRNNCLLR